MNLVVFMGVSDVEAREREAWSARARFGPSPPVVATPHLPRYASLVELCCRRLGHPLEAFRGYRMTLTYPPIPSGFVIHHPLGRV